MDKMFFKDYVQAFTANKTLKPSIRSQTNIKAAYELLSNQIASIISNHKLPSDTLSWLKVLRSTAANDLVMTYIPVEDEREAFHIFETLNDRGLRLSVPDLLLNHLMKRSKPSDRPDIRACWDKMIGTMGQRKTSDYLRAVWVSEFGDLKKTDLFKALKLFLKENGTESLEYAKRCASQCETYCALLDGDETKIGKAAQLVRRLVRVLGAYSAVPLLLSGHATLSQDNFKKLVGYLTVFMVRYSIIAEKGTGEMEDMFFSMARKLRETMCKDIGNTKKEADALDDIKIALQSECPSNERMIELMKEVILTAQNARYIVESISNMIQSKTKEIVGGDTNVEHIFPQGNPSEWPNAEELKPLIWNVGNLTMLGRHKNEDAENFAYEKKKLIYEGSDVSMAKNVSKFYTEWNAENIRKRAEWMGTYAVQIWSFSNLSRL